MRKKLRYFILTLSAILVIAGFSNVKECSAIDFVEDHNHADHAVIHGNTHIDDVDVKTENPTNIQNNDTALIQNDDDTEKNEEKPAFIAIVTFNKGRNKIVRKDSTIEKCKIDLTLFEGDKIEVSKRGKVSIVYKKSGIYYALKPEETLVISAKDEAAKQEIDLSKVNEAIVKNINSNDGKPIISAVAGTRERKDPNHPFPLTLRNTHVLFTDKIEFAWEAPEGLNLKDKDNPIKFKVHLLHKGDEIKTFTTESTSLILELKKHNLQPGTLYYWYVERTDMPRVATVKPFFKVLTEDESNKINKVLKSIEELKTDDMDGSYLVMQTRVLLENSLFQKAIATLTKCYAMVPGEEGLLETINKTYQAQGFYPEDIERFIKALKKKHPEETEDDEKSANQTQPK